jgi:hypothetical protein
MKIVSFTLNFRHKSKRVGEKFLVRQAPQRGEITMRRSHYNRGTAGIDLMTGQVAVILKHRLMHETLSTLPIIRA